MKDKISTMNKTSLRTVPLGASKNYSRDHVFTGREDAYSIVFKKTNRKLNVSTYSVVLMKSVIFLIACKRRGTFSS